MLCQHCGQNEANRHYRTTLNNQTQETHLCAACAANTGFDQEFQKTFPTFSFSFPAIMSDMLGLHTPQRSEGICPVCGSRLEELARTGQAGCANCYDVFSPVLTPYIRRVHGDAKHTGKVPGGALPALKRRRQMEALQGKLQEAIQSQSFEQAAEIRDEIARLKKEGESE